MKLFYSPNACSLGIHVLLEEIGKPFEPVRLDFSQGAQYKEPYVSLNPKSKVPALALDNGTILTEFPAIAWYLARTNPDKALLPEGAEAEARVLEAMDYMIATVHMRGFTRIFRPGNFTPTTSDEPAVQRTGREMAEAGFRLLAAQLGDRTYLFGDFSIADCALFFLTHWAHARANIPLPPVLLAYLERLYARPAVQRALKREGLA